MRLDSRYWTWALLSGKGREVDFVLHGERGLVAIEVKRSARVRPEDLQSLRVLREDYPEARAYLLHLGSRRGQESGINVLPVTEALREIDSIL